MPHTTPKYEHDCNLCKFLGHVTIDGKDADIYVCEHDGKQFPDLVYRHSSVPEDYGSCWPDYCTALSPWSMVALSLYVKHLGANGANAFYRGTFSDGDKVVLKLG